MELKAAFVVIPYLFNFYIENIYNIYITKKWIHV